MTQGGRLAPGIVIVLAVTVAGGVVYWTQRGGTGGAPMAPEAPRSSLYETQDPPLEIGVFFASADGSLTAERRTIFKSGQRINQYKQALLDLLKGPAGEGHGRVIPEGTALREVYVDAKGTVYADWSEALAGPAGSLGEWLRLQSIAGTLMGNFEEVKGVMILVEGKSLDTLAGHLDLSEPVVFDRSLVVKEEAAPPEPEGAP